jgi:hypothetical protein
VDTTIIYNVTDQTDGPRKIWPGKKPRDNSPARPKAPLGGCFCPVPEISYVGRL